MAANETVTRKGNVERVRNTETGEVTYRRVRGNGTTRNLPLLSAGDRSQAEAFQADREAGTTMKAIAAANHVSVSTVRRALNHLALTVQHEQNVAKAAKLQAAKQAKRNAG